MSDLRCSTREGSDPHMNKLLHYLPRSSGVGSIRTVQVIKVITLTFLATALLIFVVKFTHAERSLAALSNESQDSADFVIPPKLKFNVRDFGAVGDGTTDDTAAFELAINAVRLAGSGSVVVPASEYLIRPINLTSNMELYISSGARIKGVADAEAWPVIPGAPSYGQGRDHQGPRHTSLLHGEYLSNVTIRGEGNQSILDGQGKYWWDRHLGNLEGNTTRGHLIEFMYSDHVHVYDISLFHSPFWNHHFFDCDRVHVKGVNVVAPDDSPNTDGFDPDSSRNVLIEDSWYSGGDDCVAIKSGWDCFGVAYGKPSVNITIRNMSCHGRLAGIAIGSEMSGGIENVTVAGCRFSKSNQPAHIKTGPTRGGYVHNVFYNDMTVRGEVEYAIFIDASYPAPNPSCPANWKPKNPTSMANYSFVNFDGRAAHVKTRTYHFNGPSEKPITGIYLENVHFGKGHELMDWRCVNVAGSANKHSVEPWPPCHLISPTDRRIDKQMLHDIIDGTFFWLNQFGNLVKVLFPPTTPNQKEVTAHTFGERETPPLTTNEQPYNSQRMEVEDRAGSSKHLDRQDLKSVEDRSRSRKFEEEAADRSFDVKTLTFVGLACLAFSVEFGFVLRQQLSTAPSADPASASEPLLAS